MLHGASPNKRFNRCTLLSTTPVPARNESYRLSILRHYGILDTPPEAPFERITTLAAILFNVPIAVIGFLDCDRLWFKSHRGLPANEVQRIAGSYSSTFRALIGGGVDSGFFASAPLRTHDGFDMGEVCVIDVCPHRVEKHLVRNLELVADLVMDQLEHRLSARRAQAAPAASAVCARFTSLTLRQREVLERVIAGQASKNIAADLGISRRTVETHRASIMQRTGATSIPALVQLALLGGGRSADRGGPRREDRGATGPA